MSREEEIFAEALALAGAERVAFLDRVCAGAAALLARVEADELSLGEAMAASALQEARVLEDEIGRAHV